MAEPIKKSDQLSAETTATLNYHHTNSPEYDPTFGQVLGGFMLGAFLGALLEVTAYTLLKYLMNPKMPASELVGPIGSLICMTFVVPFAAVILLFVLEMKRKVTAQGIYRGMHTAIVWGLGYMLWAPLVYVIAQTDVLGFVETLCVMGGWMLLYPVAAGLHLYRRRRPEAGEALL